MTSDRDRLIELFNEIEKDPAITCPHYKTEKTCDTCKYTINNFMCNHTERMVDYLLANGVIAPPCKVGDTLYYIPFGSTITKWEIKSIEIVQDDIVFHCGRIFFLKFDIGKTVFLTKEEAELEKRGKENG